MNSSVAISPVSDGDLVRADVTSAASTLHARIIERIARRRWPIAFTAVNLVLGIAVMLAWNPFIAHSNSWLTPGDVWEVFRGAHYVGWGFVGGIYSSGTGIVTFPGMSVILAPVAMVSYHFHLSESFAPYFLPHPSAALLLSRQRSSCRPV